MEIRQKDNIEKAKILFEKAQRAKSNKELEEAENLIKQAIELHNQVKYRKLLVDIYFQQSEYKEAEKLLNELIGEREKEIVEIKKNIDNEENEDKRKKQLKDLSIKEDKVSGYIEQLGRIYKEQRKYKDAIEQFKKSINIKDNVLAHLNLGLTYLEVENLQLAEQHFDCTFSMIGEEEKKVELITDKQERIIKSKSIGYMKQNLCNGYYDLSREYEKRGDKEKSRKLRENAKNLNENDKRILLDEIKIYIANGEYEKAKEFLKRGREFLNKIYTLEYKMLN